MSTSLQRRASITRRTLELQPSAMPAEARQTYGESWRERPFERRRPKRAVPGHHPPRAPAKMATPASRPGLTMALTRCCPTPVRGHRGLLATCPDTRRACATPRVGTLLLLGGPREPTTSRRRAGSAAGGATPVSCALHGRLRASSAGSRATSRWSAAAVRSRRLRSFVTSGKRRSRCAAMERRGSGATSAERPEAAQRWALSSQRRGLTPP